MTFAWGNRAHIDVVEAFGHVKLHKSRASFIDVQRFSTSMCLAPGCSFTIREVSDCVPVPHGRRTVLPLAYVGVKPLAVPLPQQYLPRLGASHKEILLI
ncbi:hypothetical protein [Dinghuibacter silviterrae]|nr:hypothetical protein [Dinghuibacter silviterrae]